MLFAKKNTAMVAPENALPGRTDQTMPVPEKHFVLDAPLRGPWPTGTETAVFGMGCFWGAERLFWQLPGVYSTAVGYAGGYTPNCTYEENCSGLTGHAEVFFVIFDPKVISYESLLKVFWENHDPTQACVRETTWVRSIAARFTRQTMHRWQLLVRRTTFSKKSSRLLVMVTSQQRSHQWVSGITVSRITSSI